MNYLLIGHSTADLVADERILGGTVSYAAHVAHRFEHDVRILTSAAKNEPLFAPLYEFANLHLIPAEHTTTFSNIYTDEGRTQYVHHTASNLTYEMLPQEWHKTELVHLAPLVNETDKSIAAKFPNATVLLTPQGYLRKWGEDGRVYFKRFLDADILETIDILVLSKQDIWEAPDLEYEFPKYTEHVVVTNGKEGGTYYHNGEAIPYTAYKVAEIDPTGAGDVFAASLLSSLPLLNYNMLAAIDVAAKMAAYTVTAKGASPTFTREDIQNAIQEAQQKYD